MTALEFVRKIQDFWSKDLTADQVEDYVRLLRKIPEDDLGVVCDRVLETSNFFPRPAAIFSAAEDVGVSRVAREKPTKLVDLSMYDHTGCQLCEGQGLIESYWELYQADRGDRKEERMRLVAVRPPSSREKDEPRGAGIYRYMHRCDCVRGESEHLPKCFPVWNKLDPSDIRHVPNVDPL